MKKHTNNSCGAQECIAFYFDDKWTGGVLTIAEKYQLGGLLIYRFADCNNDEIQGTFYQSEIHTGDVKERVILHYLSGRHSAGNSRMRGHDVIVL